MEPGTDVREVVTGKRGVIVDGGLTLFPSIKGHMRLDGTYDSGLRDIPHRLLRKVELPAEAVMEAIANVLQAEG